LLRLAKSDPIVGAQVMSEPGRRSDFADDVQQDQGGIEPLRNANGDVDFRA
jgi:hypothetical protein